MIAANRILAPALLAALASLIAPASGVSQATVRGRVIDSEMGTPLAGATVQVGKSGPAVKTDSGGVFVAQNVTPGVIEIEIRQIGFEPGTFDIRIPASGVVQGVFPLDFNGYMLPAVVVEARAAALMPRYNDFEQRRQRKMGAYLRWDELKKQGVSSIGDALRTVRGVRRYRGVDEVEAVSLTTTPSKVTDRGLANPAVSTVTRRSLHRARTLIRRFATRAPVPT